MLLDPFLLKWLRWGWQCFSEGGLWKKVVIRRRKDKGEPPEIPEILWKRLLR
jgi:hypothetical protein